MGNSQFDPLVKILVDGMIDDDFDGSTKLLSIYTTAMSRFCAHGPSPPKGALNRDSALNEIIHA